MNTFPDVHHVYLSSGACLPLRPVEELIDYLADRPRVDFIESATTADVSWTIGGLDQERFTLRFPFSWRKNRKLFDAYVKLQRATRYAPQDTRRVGAAYGQSMVVPDPPDPVGHSAGPQASDL